MLIPQFPALITAVDTMYARKLESIIDALLQEFRIIYLTGPRQAGKTTIVQAVANRVGMSYITLDNETTLESVRSDPRGFILSFGEQPLALDEFQYVPSLIYAIKAASDGLKPEQKGRFLLTGSADIFRSAKAQEALPGHMARLTLYPLSLTEMTKQSRNIVDYLLADDLCLEPASYIDRKRLAQYILNGGYPEVQTKSDRAKRVWFNSYIEGRLYKDFASLYSARGDLYSKLHALLPYLAGLSGNLLKYANVSNALELDDKQVKAYIEILELMFIVRRVPAYLKNRSKRAATRMPKLHFVDTGLACHLLGLHSRQQLMSHTLFGSLLESLIYMELCKQSAWAQDDITLYHFRDNRKNAVDIVIEKTNGAVIGVEIKAAASVTIKDFAGLAKLAEYAGVQFERGVLLYTGERILPFQHNGLRFYAVPLGLFLGK